MGEWPLTARLLPCLTLCLCLCSALDMNWTLIDDITESSGVALSDDNYFFFTGSMKDPE